jgi:hypothetical protein
MLFALQAEWRCAPSLIVTIQWPIRAHLTNGREFLGNVYMVNHNPIVQRHASTTRKRPMKIIAYDNFKAGVSIEDLKPYLRDEVSNVWRLWKAGIVRENYARADVGGVIIVFELDSVEAVKRYTDDFPLTKAGLLEWHFLAFDAPLPLEYLFDGSVDVAQPWDRTAA